MASGRRTGYRIGLNDAPDRGERIYSLRSDQETILKPNIGDPFHADYPARRSGIAISESIRITETGADTFCGFPRQHFVR